MLLGNIRQQFSSNSYINALNGQVQFPGQNFKYTAGRTIADKYSLYKEVRECQAHSSCHLEIQARFHLERGMKGSLQMSNPTIFVRKPLSGQCAARRKTSSTYRRSQARSDKRRGNSTVAALSPGFSGVVPRMVHQCDFCKNAEAGVFCFADQAVLCDACDQRCGIHSTLEGWKKTRTILHILRSYGIDLWP